MQSGWVQSGTMSRKITLLIPLLVAALAIPASAQASPADLAQGIWLNPSHSVAVRTGPCESQGNQGLCGRVVWANAKARADAQASGIAVLNGTELLQNYHQAGPATWQGTVYVPDMGRRFDSHIEPLSPDRLKISGCILGGLFCRSQVWTRLAGVPA